MLESIPYWGMVVLIVLGFVILTILAVMAANAQEENRAVCEMVAGTASVILSIGLFVVLLMMNGHYGQPWGYIALAHAILALTFGTLMWGHVFLGLLVLVSIFIVLIGKFFDN